MLNYIEDLHNIYDYYRFHVYIYTTKNSIYLEFKSMITVCRQDLRLPPIANLQ